MLVTGMGKSVRGRAEQNGDQHNDGSNCLHKAHETSLRLSTNANS